jgi:NitT/TauT family transport system substrate-binding protein
MKKKCFNPFLPSWEYVPDGEPHVFNGVKNMAVTAFKNRFSLTLVIITLCNAAFLYARGNDDARKNELTIYGLKGPSGVGIIRLFESPPMISGFNVKVEALASDELMAARFISGEAKIGMLPVNRAAKIFSSGKDVRVIAVIGEGMLSLLSSDPSVRGIGDLRGKTIEVAAQGATPEYVFRRILMRNGLDPDRDVTMSFALPYPEIAQSLIAGKISIGLIPEPFVTMARMGKPDLIVAADIQEEWMKTEGGRNYPMTLLVADGEFASAYPQAVNAIYNAVKDSITWVVANPAEAGILVEKHGLGLKAPVAAAAIPKSNYTNIPAIEARPFIEALLKTYLEFAPASIGGALPGGRFYWNGNR